MVYGLFELLSTAYLCQKYIFTIMCKHNYNYVHRITIM